MHCGQGSGISADNWDPSPLSSKLGLVPGRFKRGLSRLDPSSTTSIDISRRTHLTAHA